MIEQIDYTSLPYAEYNTQAGHLVLLDRKNRPLKRRLPDGFVIDYSTTCPINLAGDIIVERRWFELGSLSMTIASVEECRRLLAIWPDHNVEYKLIRNDCRYRLEEAAIRDGNVRQYRASIRSDEDSEYSGAVSRQATPSAQAREKRLYDRLQRQETPYRIYRGVPAPCLSSTKLSGTAPGTISENVGNHTGTDVKRNIDQTTGVCSDD